MDKLNYELYKKLIDKVFDYLEINDFSFDEKKFKIFAEKDLLSQGISKTILNSYLKGNNVCDFSNEESFKHAIYCVERKINNLSEMYKDEEREFKKFSIYFNSYKNQLLNTKEKTILLDTKEVSELIIDEVNLLREELENQESKYGNDEYHLLKGQLTGYRVYSTIYGFEEEFSNTLQSYCSR